MRFLHIADVHLGNQQYNRPERCDDFYQAFEQVTDLALEENVQACVIAGDLFHKATVDPLTLTQAEECLDKLAKNDVRAVMISGNHDRGRYRDDYFSWLNYLAHRRLIQLLTPTHLENRLLLEPQRGYTDIEGTRFIGVPWYGASIRQVIQQMPEALDQLTWDSVEFSTLLMHAAIEGQMPNQTDCVLHSDLAPLRERINYLAMGHLHKPYHHDNWIYNPGSLESCSSDEAEYERGAYLVDITAPGTHQIQHIRTRSRPFHKLFPFVTDRYSTPELLMKALEEYIESECQGVTYDREPIVQVTLRGVLTFDRMQLDVEAIKCMVRAAMSCLVVNVKVDCLPQGLDVQIEDDLSRDALELQVFQELVRNDTRYSNSAPAWAQIIQHIKRLSTTDSPETIYNVLDQFMQSH